MCDIYGVFVEQTEQSSSIHFAKFSSFSFSSSSVIFVR